MADSGWPSGRRAPVTLARRAGVRIRGSVRALRGRSPDPSTVAQVGHAAWWSELRPTGWWDLLPFSAHRICLAPGRFTMDAHGYEAADDVRTSIVCEELGDSLDRSTVADLGCLEGAISFELARRGARQVIGVDVRQLSIDRCNMVQDFLRLPNVEFRCADLHAELGRWPEGFDAVVASGILYHLPDPARSLSVIRSSCRQFALIDTHVADPDRPTHSCSADVTDLRSGNATYSGRWSWEYDAAATREEQETYLWASYGNPQSFWPFEEDLVRMIRDAGFVDVEKVDPHAHGGRWQTDELNRVMYVCRV